MNSQKQQYKQQLNEVRSLMDRLCGTTLLAESMSLDDIHEKYYADINKDTFDKIVAADPTSKPERGKRGKYCTWLLDLYRKHRLKTEDLYKATEYLTVAKRLNGFDINDAESLPELYGIVKPYLQGEATSKSEEERQIKKGAKRFYEDDEWLVVVPMTKEAAILYGKGTQWCTAATKSDNYYDEYVRVYGEGCLYININKKTGQKYQFCEGSGEYMNESDGMIDPFNIGLSEGLLEKYTERHGRLTHCFNRWTLQTAGGERRFKQCTMIDGSLYRCDREVFDIKSGEKADTKRLFREVCKAVDLGLSSGTKWASMNVGAIAEHDSGDYFAWGEAEPKDMYDWRNYDESVDSFCDTVTANMGSGWRMPTRDECMELLRETDQQWVRDFKGTGVNGMVFYNRKDRGKYMFIPSASYIFGGFIEGVGSGGYVWTSSLKSDLKNFAWYLYLSGREAELECRIRCFGQSVRGVVA